MKVEYKWPIVKNKTHVQNNLNQAALINQKTGNIVENSKQTTAVGTTTVIFYLLMLLYIYITGALSDTGNIKSDFLGILLNSIKNGKFLKLNTLSISLQHSERIGTTILLVCFLATLQTLFASQNMYIGDDKRSLIVAFNYIIVLCWLLFLYIFPSKTIGKKETTSTAHAFLVFCIMLSIIINSFLIIDLYSVYYDAKSLESLKIITYIIVFFCILCGLVMLFTNIFTNFMESIMIAYFELICLILFGIFLIIFIQFPPLPSNELSCVMVDKE